MQKPKPLKADQLQHPKNSRRSSFNGDIRRGDDKQGFIKANRITVTEGTRAPQRVKKHVGAHLCSDGSVGGRRDLTGAIQPLPEGHSFGPCLVNNKPTTSASTFDLADLKAHQKSMLHSRNNNG
nr:hypothetical protein 5 [bacterium]